MATHDGRIVWIVTLVAFVIGILIGSSYFNTTTGSRTCEHESMTRTTTRAFNSSNSLESALREDIIQERIAEAESIFQLGVKTRHKIEIERPGALANPLSGSELTVIWDFFYPTFSCPHLVERLGRVGDGGKWVCGVSHLAKRAKSCVVYGYGISGDSSFEQDILSRTNCTLRAFDHTVDPENVELTKKYPTRSSFDQIGLGAENTKILRTLKSEMEKHGDVFIDILKLDVEGAEYAVFRQVMKDFPDKLPFGQLLIEIHLNAIGSRANMYSELKKWWEALESTGLRPFNREPNLYAGIAFFEYSFLNVRGNHSLLHA